MAEMDPIRLLHIADVHIGMENYGRTDGATGLNTRVIDFLRCLDEAVDYALENDVDVCIFAGDAYKNRRPNPTHQREFARRIKTMAGAGIPVVLVPGNHDVPSADRHASSLDIFGVLDIPNVTVADREKLRRIQTRRGREMLVAPVPYPLRSRLMADADYRNLTLGEIDRALADLLAENVRAMAAEAREHPELPAVLAGHFTVSEASFGSERSVMVGRDVIMLRSIIADPTWDYVAMGHIHRHQCVNEGEHPPIVYAGSIERIDFGEEKEPKGFVVAELEKGKTTFRFHEVAARKFLTVDVDVRGESKPTDRVLDAIEKRRGEMEGAVVRLVVRLKQAQEKLVDKNRLRRALEPAHFVAGMSFDVERETRLRLGVESVESLSPIEALEKYLEAKDTPEGRKEMLLKHAKGLMADEA